MAHYALIDENGIVVNVITGIDEDDTSTLPEEFSSWEEFYGNFHNLTCKRTSYNTKGNVHHDNGVAFRGNYAEIDGSYDSENDVFIPPQPFESWELNSNWVWVPPVAYPTDGNIYVWFEKTQEWILYN
jgi:hypothetical protein